MCRQLARSVCHQSGRKRNLSPLHLTAFKPTRKASRYSNAKPQVAGELQSPSPSYPFLTRDLQPQERKWPPNPDPKGSKTGSVFFFPDTSQPVDPACTLSSVLHILQHLWCSHPLPRHRCWPLKPSTKVFRVSRSFLVYKWTLRPSTQRKAITNSLP